MLFVQLYPIVLFGYWNRPGKATSPRVYYYGSIAYFIMSLYVIFIMFMCSLIDVEQLVSWHDVDCLHDSKLQIPI